eukprot:m.142754 g.142754  ORF g.142754 m.142754 type:complete len:579 (+) comp30269_c0_seq1:129-1865(+)
MATQDTAIVIDSDSDEVTCVSESSHAVQSTTEPVSDTKRLVDSSPNQSNKRRREQPPPKALTSTLTSDVDKQPVYFQTDEELARQLQLEEHERATEVFRSNQQPTPARSTPTVDTLFKLTTVDTRDSRTTNLANHKFSTCITSILSLGRLTSSVQFNYLIDINWLMSKYPQPARTLPLLIVHGYDKGSGLREKLETTATDYEGVRLFQAPKLEPFGCHHTKMMLLFYAYGMRVVVHTANLTHSDWTYATQGVWVSPVFQRKDANVDKVPMDTIRPPPCVDDTMFAHDLFRYLQAYCPGRPDLNPMVQTLRKVAAHDIKISGVRFLGSVPGRHTGPALNSWGQRQLRRYLKEVPTELCKVDDEILLQFSSIGSMGGKENTKWLDQLKLSLCGADSVTNPSVTNTSVKLLFPSTENVRTSNIGYVAGSSIPYAAKNDAKQQFLRTLVHQWKADWSYRTRVQPHIKTYARWNNDTKEFRWYILTSANLSQAAWGADEKAASQIHIRHYEAGILFLPSADVRLFSAQHDAAITRVRKEGKFTPQLIPVPYDLPLTPYGSHDTMWLWDIHHNRPDSQGTTWRP